MTTKAERLAKELVGLSVKYSGQDFDKAIELISSEKFFQSTLVSVKKVRNTLRSKQRPKRGERTEIETTELTISEKFDALLTENPKLREFSDSFLKKEILVDGQSVRAFGEIADLELPKKLPSRTVLLERFIRHLMSLSPAIRNILIDQSPQIGNRESSLQLWSDVIVKEEGKDS